MAWLKKRSHINRDCGDILEFVTPNKEETNNSRLEKPIFQTRFYQILVVFIFISMFIFGRILYIGVIKGKDYANLYKIMHNRTEWILAPRGLIKDRNGAVLAYNVPGKNSHEFRRFYPEASFFASLIGYIGRVDGSTLSKSSSYLPFDLVGKTGIEAQYEEYLRGTHGRIDRPIYASGQVLQKPLITPPKAGNTLILTIDAQIQKTLTLLLKERMREIGAKGAAAIVLNPWNGAILSLISLPSFDNNLITNELLKDPGRPLFNRAIAGQYPPGSTIKPFLASAALDEKIILPSTLIYDHGKISVQSTYDPTISWIFRGWKALGPVDMKRAIALSSNIYFYTIGGGYQDTKGLGIERIINYVNLFGFGQKRKIDIPGEREGFIPTPQWKKEHLAANWFIGDTYNTSIGQGFLRITPLQLAVASAAIVNGGSLMKPHLLDKVVDEKGATLFSFQSEHVRDNLLSSQNGEIIREAMRMAVTQGTVWRLNALPKPVAAKTGTAQAGKGREPHAWITLFAPYDNPEIVVTILIEHGIGGEQSAVPVAKDFLEWYFTKLKVQS